MRTRFVFPRLALFPLAAALGSMPGAAQGSAPIVAKFRLDHNRLIVDAEMRKPGGGWRPVKLWLDSGIAGFTASPGLAAEMGLRDSGSGPAVEIRAGGAALDLSGLRETAVDATAWLLPSAGADATLTTSVLRRYDVLIDFPASAIELHPPGRMPRRGRRISAAIDPRTGVAQVDLSIGGEALSLAVDLGASYTFVDGGFLDPLAASRPEWPGYVGPAGCANMWGYWPAREDTWKVYRLPSVVLGSGEAAIAIEGLGVVSLPPEILGGLGSWYSAKTSRRVEGFLGPNALKAFRVGIDYAGGALYLERTGAFDDRDMDLVPVGVRMQGDGSWAVFDVARRKGRPLTAALVPGDRLVSIDGAPVKGLSMGRVVDALRGTPGSRREIVVLRDGKELRLLVATVRLL